MKRSTKLILEIVFGLLLGIAIGLAAAVLGTG